MDLNSTKDYYYSVYLLLICITHISSIVLNSFLHLRVTSLELFSPLTETNLQLFLQKMC